MGLMAYDFGLQLTLFFTPAKLRKEAGMDLKGIMNQQAEGARAMSSAGVIGLHMVSGPAVGFGIGYGLDCWLATTPWCGLGFLLIGIGAGFLNVWRDMRQLVRKLDK